MLFKKAEHEINFADEMLNALGSSCFRELSEFLLIMHNIHLGLFCVGSTSQHYLSSK